MAKIKRRKINKETLALRKQFNADQKQLEIDSQVTIDPVSMKKKIPNRRKRINYIKALIESL